MAFSAAVKNYSSHTGMNLQINLNTGFVDVKDDRDTIAKIKDVVFFILNLIFIRLSKIPERVYAKITNQNFPTPLLNTDDGKYHYPDADLPWAKAESSKGLFLCIPGLNGHPADYKKYINKFVQDFKGCHVCVLSIAKFGNCALEISASPVLELVEKYLQKFPGNPVTIIGTSNGGRIAQYVESRLNPERVTKLSIVTLAGVHFGTTFIAFLERLYLLWLPNLDLELIEEFRWNSPVAQAELKLWNEKQVIWDHLGKDVTHLFCATMNDEHVWSNSSSLPHSKHSKHSYSVYRGASHSSIVPYALPDVVKFLTPYKIENDVTFNDDMFSMNIDI